MSRERLLTIISLLSILLLSLHFVDDIVRRISPPGADNIGAVVILLVWLYGTLMLSGRRAGYGIMLLGGVFAAAMPVIHMTGKSYPEIAVSSGGSFFVWTIVALGVTGAFSSILAVCCLWDPERGKSAWSE
ncbi:MAG TPA: hypothetical protein VMS29_05630 [Pyrinomonadaceae bacterium]|nr:hypothetical protein [Pyrinomonadaceae bacterium]